VELLVVIVIIVILISAVLAATSTLVNKAKVSNTQAMLTVVRDAVEQFRREQTSKRTITKNQAHRQRYGDYPPDELEVFTSLGMPGSGPGGGTLAPGGAVMVPDPPTSDGYGPMMFYTKGLPDAQQPMEHRDLVAMIVAIQTLGDASSAILDGIQDRYWFAPLDVGAAPPAPSVFLDRPDPTSGDPNGIWDADDLQIRYIIDDWGNPISYMTQRNWEPLPGSPDPSTNHPSWNEASTEFVRLNGGQPVIFSYGPDGKEQLTAEAMGTDGDASLVGDFADDADGVINNPMNADNLYADPTLAEKLPRAYE
jgi:type II secretory pathway pseudopilin PulG